MPDTVYPLLHVGVHELPLTRNDAHGAAIPFAGGSATPAKHATGLHTAVSVIFAPSLLQYREPSSVYPLLHVG